MLPAFIIGLREGLEASLIVGIIAAFLVQRGERGGLRAMWLGVALAVALCVGAAVGLSVLGSALPLRLREGMEGAFAIVAVIGVTYMILWMRRHSRDLRRDLEASAAAALVGGSVMGLVGMAFIAVLREGIETAVFMLAAFQSSLDPVATGAGAVLGVVVAVVLGYLIYRGGVRINLSRFFRITGLVLVLVAAGLLATSLHAFGEAGLVQVFTQPALNLSWLVAPSTIQGALLTGLFGFQPVPTVGELALWLAYAVPVSIYVLWPQRRPIRPAPTEQATAGGAS